MTGGGRLSNSMNAPLQVVRYIATRSGDPERGPHVWINDEDARKRFIVEGELVWVYGPRRHDLTPVGIDDTLPRGAAIVRDILGVAVSEVIRLVKPDFDRPQRGTFA